MVVCVGGGGLLAEGKGTLCALSLALTHDRGGDGSSGRSVGALPVLSATTHGDLSGKAKRTGLLHGGE